MDDETRNAISGLKELITMKFEALEQILEIKDTTVNERRAAQAAKDAEQDVKIGNLEDRVACLEKAPAEDTHKRWQNIIDKILSWLVPFLLMGIVYWASTGFKIK